TIRLFEHLDNQPINNLSDNTIYNLIFDFQYLANPPSYQKVSDTFFQAYQQYDHFNVNPDNPQEEAAKNKIEEIGSEGEDLINLEEESDGCLRMI
ncbi:12149_t:CDS:1, partial [Racocetra fulgida]